MHNFGNSGGSFDDWSTLPGTDPVNGANQGASLGKQEPEKIAAGGELSLIGTQALEILNYGRNHQVHDVVNYAGKIASRKPASAGFLLPRIHYGGTANQHYSGRI